MNNLKVTLIQTFLHWEDPVKNREHFQHLLNRIECQSDLILLPEMFNTGFSINPMACAETMDGPSVSFLYHEAAKRNAFIMATLLIRERDDFFNRLICISPDGSIQTYDKRHLFRLSEEYRILKPGNTRKIFQIKGWKIMPSICYDLRFPVWTKNSFSERQYEYDALVCLANWPESRQHVWQTLLMARAMENQAFVMGINRIGKDGHGTPHSGDSMVVDAWGNILMKAAQNMSVVDTVHLSLQDLQDFRKSFMVGKDWDHFSLL